MKSSFFCSLLFIVLLHVACSSPSSQQAITSPLSLTQATLYQTADSTSLRLSLTDTLSFSPLEQPSEGQIVVFADTEKTFQTFLGMGGAVTDAAAETFYKLPKDKQEEVLAAYYGDAGIGYTFTRTNLNSCDFSSDMYTYVQDNDTELKTFTIAHDKKYKLPLLKAIQEKSKHTMRYFASPWSPPAWMKDNNDRLHGGHLKKEYYSVWASYFVKFIRAYKQEGIALWGVTMQNEMMATQRWESCLYTANEEVAFLKQLGSTFKKEKLSDVKIMGWDHNRDLMYQRASAIFSDPEAAQYLWGIAFHWYENWSGGLNMFENVGKVHESFPNTHLFFTEGCAESFDQDNIHSVRLGERYAYNIIHDFNNGMCAFTDWNILLDEKGGPNHVGNFCFAPIHANTQTGELIYTSSYYYIGHFSKFVKPQAKRMQVSTSRSILSATGFINPTGERVVIVLNQSATEVPYFLWVNGQAVSVKIKPHAIQTVVF